MSTPAAPDPPAEPERRSIKEIVDQLLDRYEPEPEPELKETIDQLLARYELEREQELDHGDGPAGQAYFVLEVRGVPQSVSGPYGQAEPESAADSEAELGHEYDGPELGQAGSEPEAEPGPEPEAEP
jgi:hypothetical protein